MNNYFIKLIIKNILTAIIYVIIIPKIIPNNLFLQFVLSTIIVELIFNNINLDNFTGGEGEDEPDFCKVICSGEDNPKMCEKICKENNYITSDIKGGNQNDNTDINLICRNICKNNKYNLNCIKNCEIDFQTI